MRRRLLTVVMLCGAVAAGLALEATAGQGLAGLQANWRDLETWSHLDSSTRETELGLGLQPSGGALIAFLGRLSLSSPRTPPTELTVQVAPGYMSNPNVLRTATLTILADGATKDRLEVDLGPRMMTDGGAAGGIVHNAISRIRAADFVRLTESETLTATILGFDVEFNGAQIQAMKALAERLYLKKK